MKNRFSIAVGFLALIAAGAVFLASPFARAAGVWGAPLDALFTAASAVCVTGLTVVDVAKEYSLAGQIALLALVEIGGLGLMTCGTFFLIAIGRRLSLSREFTLMNAYGVAEVQGLKGLVCWVVGSTLFIESLNDFYDMQNNCLRAIKLYDQYRQLDAAIQPSLQPFRNLKKAYSRLDKEYLNLKAINHLSELYIYIRQL